MTQTKTSINPYTRTSQEGQLYSLTSILPTRFVGEIEGIDDQLDLFKTLRVGAYTSTGYGKCKVVQLKKDKNNDVKPSLADVEVYSKRYKTYQRIGHTDKHYIVLLLEADAHLEVSKQIGYSSTESYMKEWERLLGLPVGKLHKVYFDCTLYKGYDTSKVGTDYRAKPQYHIHKGGIIILEVEDLEGAYSTYYRGYAIGNEILNGYGQCKLYCGEEKNNE